MNKSNYIINPSVLPRWPALERVRGVTASRQTLLLIAKPDNPGSPRFRSTRFYESHPAAKIYLGRCQSLELRAPTDYYYNTLQTTV